MNTVSSIFLVHVLASAPEAGNLGEAPKPGHGEQVASS
jgi:hypothetical protein